VGGGHRFETQQSVAREEQAEAALADCRHVEAARREAVAQGCARDVAPAAVATEEAETKAAEAAAVAAMALAAMGSEMRMLGTGGGSDGSCSSSRAATVMAPILEQMVNEPERMLQLLQAQQERELCVICMDKPKTYLIAPCGHKCLCEDCAESLERQGHGDRNKTCPICRVPMQRMFKVFE